MFTYELQLDLYDIIHNDNILSNHWSNTCEEENLRPAVSYSGSSLNEWIDNENVLWKEFYRSLHEDEQNSQK